MAYDPTKIVSDSNPLPVTTDGSTYDPTKVVSDSNPLPVTIVP